MGTITREMLRELPAELLEQLRVGARRNSETTGAMVYDVLGDDPMSLNEVLIAVWHQFGKVMKRSTAMAAIAMLRKNGDVTAVDRGYYVRTA